MLYVKFRNILESTRISNEYRRMFHFYRVFGTLFYKVSFGSRSEEQSSSPRAALVIIKTSSSWRDQVSETVLIVIIYTPTPGIQTIHGNASFLLVVQVPRTSVQFRSIFFFFYPTFIFYEVFLFFPKMFEDKKCTEQDLKVQAALERKRQQEEERKARIFNPRARKIGVSVCFGRMEFSKISLSRVCVCRM